MRKIILALHTTLDGFVAGPNGEMNCFKVDDEVFYVVGKLTEEADTALYGRKTYQMMESYWPTAAAKPNATRHDIEHSNWYNRCEKVVLSKTLKGSEKSKTTIISDNVAAELGALKSNHGKNILMFGSPTAAHSLMQHNLVDEYWLFINPVLLGQGIPMFAKIKEKVNLQLVTTKVFSCGVTALNYTVAR